MNTKMKMLLFGLFLVVSLGVNAQDKYEYAKVFDLGGKLTVIYSNAETEKISFEKTSDLAKYHEQLLQVVGKMADNGWELFLTSENITGGTTIYFLKRKKK